MTGKHGSVEERFWPKVQKGTQNECWLWIGPMVDGYGYLSSQGRHLRAHRISWELAHGPIPDGMNVLHDCPGGDTRACVNPAHLWLGTLGDNNLDMAKKGHHWTHVHPETIARGEKNHAAKLTWAAVEEIRQVYIQGKMSQRGLARRYEVSQKTIWRVVHRMYWLATPEDALAKAAKPCDST